MTDKLKRIPVQSGSMYIALSQLRGQASSARWQHAVVFLALNAPLVALVRELVVSATSARQIAFGFFVSLLTAAMNALWMGLVQRENRWIHFYAEKLRAIEEAFGTESGVLVFAAEDFPARTVGAEVSFRRGIWLLSSGAALMWLLAGFILVGVAIFMWGAGK